MPAHRCRRRLRHRAQDVVPAFADAESVETLRNEDDGFSLLATIAHPGGISENYVGMVKGRSCACRPATSCATRFPTSTPVRLWGLVNGNLIWDWEIADAEGQVAQARFPPNCARPPR